MREKIISPTQPVLTLSELREHFGIVKPTETSRDTAFIQSVIAAQEIIELHCRIALNTQTRIRYIDKFDGTIPLTREIQSIESVKYLDKDRIQQTLDPQSYFLNIPDNSISFVGSLPVVYPTPACIEIEYICGYQTLPQGITHAIKIIVGHLVNFQKSIEQGKLTSRPNEFNRLIEPYKDYRNYFEQA